MAIFRTASQGDQRSAAAPYLVLGAVLLVLGLAFMMSDRGTLQMIVSRSTTGAAQLPNCTGDSTHKQPYVGTLPPGTLPMAFPSKEAYERVLADPSLPEKDAELLKEFEATPWLLPPRTKALPYTGVHNLDQLVALRATGEGRLEKAITLLTFTNSFAVMTQNTIYSMVKYAGVRNYVVGTWEAADLEACADLNLPCADVSSYLPENMTQAGNTGALGFGSHDYLVVTWLRPQIVRELLKKGFAVYNSDSDITYVIKPAWASYLAFIDEAQADGAFQEEWGLINGGNYVMLPTPGSIAMFERWSATAHDAIKENQNDQQFLGRIRDTTIRVCTNRWGCNNVRNEMQNNNQTGKLALARTYHYGFYMYSDDYCELARPESAPLFDTCDWTILFFHPICTNYEGKRAIFLQQQLWFVNEERCLPRNGTTSQVKACEPVVAAAGQQQAQAGGGGSGGGGGGTQRSPPSVKPLSAVQHRTDLGPLLEREKLQTGAELGVQLGFFSESLLTNWPSCTRFYLVDLWGHQKNYEDIANVDQAEQDKRYQETQKRLEPWKSKTVFLRNYTTEAAKSIPDNSLDFVYVDARHDYCGVKEDLETYWPKLKSGGILAGHDYLTAGEVAAKPGNTQDWSVCLDGSKQEGAVKGAVNEFAEAHGLSILVTYNEPDWPTWMARKP